MGYVTPTSVYNQAGQYKTLPQKTTRCPFFSRTGDYCLLMALLLLNFAALELQRNQGRQVKTDGES